MAYPKFYTDARKRSQEVHSELESKKTQVRQLESEIKSKTGLVAQLKSEIEKSENEIMGSELPVLLTYNITLLGGNDGRERYYHNRIYYFADTDIIREIPQICNNDKPNQSVLPGTVDLTYSFRRCGKDDKTIAADLKAVIDHLLQGTSVSSWKQLGDLISDYYGVGAD
jgi:hypothetical protein